VVYHSSEFGSGGRSLWHNNIKIGILISWTQIDFDKITKNDEKQDINCVNLFSFKKKTVLIYLK